ncbi:MAG: hypothetical protein BWY78_00674 [Alphaproteobacteria bacterium ADurb.Bin438]|nr:MAG: hypothetical protein BWY78_00674 [Alphaproteobacteria bacterium ADurb.Bin438]
MSELAKTMNKQAAEFIPEFWSDILNKKLSKSGVAMRIVNTRYEGEIKNAGDTVRIQEVPNIAINSYDPSGALSYEEPNGESKILHIDQQKYFAFKVDDITKAQADNDLAHKFMEEAKKGIDLVKDSFILGKFADIPASNLLAPVSLTKGNAYLQFVNLAKMLKNKGAIQSRDSDIYGKNDEETREGLPFVVINPDIEAVLLQAPEFIQATEKGDKVLRTGSIGSIAGLDIMVSTNLPTVEGKVNVMAGINDAITFASQVVKIETLRDKDAFKDLVRGLYVYGAKTVIPEALAGCVMSLA